MSWRNNDTMTIWTVYQNPSDYPGKWVLRGHDVGSGTVTPQKDCFVADSYDLVITALPSGLQRLHRFPGDDPVIYETWL
jgi:hypothetical protein